MKVVVNEARRSDARATDLALAAAEAAQQKRGFNVAIIDVEGRCSYADAIVIVSATSERQAKAVADATEEALFEGFGRRPLHREGDGGWVLIDFGDVVLHVFLEEMRAYYEIDQLWSGAPRVRVPAAATIESDASETAPSVLKRRRR